MTKNEQILLGRCGYILGLMLDTPVTSSAQALLALTILRNKAEPGRDIHLAAVADAMLAGVATWVEQAKVLENFQAASPARKRPVGKPKRGKLAVTKKREV